MNTLTPDQMDELRDAAHSVEARIMDEYSGRGMFGAVCVGVVLKDEGDLFRFAGELSDELVELLGSPRWDSLGLNEIAYWPSFAA